MGINPVLCQSLVLSYIGHTGFTSDKMVVMDMPEFLLWLFCMPYFVLAVTGESTGLLKPKLDLREFRLCRADGEDSLPFSACRLCRLLLLWTLISGGMARSMFCVILCSMKSDPMSSSYSERRSPTALSII